MNTPSLDITTGTFFSALRKKVDKYFSDNNLNTTGNTYVYLKSIIQLVTAAGLYVTLVFFSPAAWLAIPLCILLGVNLAIIGFNTMHEGGHQSFSKSPWLNSVAAYMLNVLGGNQHFWKTKHNVNHHTFTNIEGLDTDIDVKPFMRLHEGQPLRWYHRFQHIYWVILYGISYLAWVFYEDFQKYFSGRISANGPRKRLSLFQHLVFWISKFMFVAAYIVLPIIMTGWLPWLIGFSIITFVCGVCISVVFQLAHVVEGTEFYQSKDGDKNDWATHQVNTTANFATDNKLLHWLLGGLNFQIEHHLFPRINHIHYPVVSKFVKETCRETGIQYKEYKTMLAAFLSHLSHLRRLGQA